MPYNGRYLRMAAGDPGLGSFLKKAVGAIGKVISSPIGTAASFVIPGGALLKGVGLASKALKLAKGAGLVAGGAGAGVVGTRLAQAARGTGFGPGDIIQGPFQAPLGWTMGAEGQAVGGMGRRRRRMNAANPRALRRSIRRLRAFEKLARGVMITRRFKAKPKLFGRRRKAA